MIDLRGQRKLAGLTQIELSAKTGVSRMKLSLAECGQAELSESEEAAIRKALLAAIKARAAELEGALSHTISRSELQPA